MNVYIIRFCPEYVVRFTTVVGVVNIHTLLTGS